VSQTKKGYVIKGIVKGKVAYFSGNERRVGTGSLGNVQTVMLVESLGGAEVFETRSKAVAKMKNQSVYYKFDSGEKFSDPHKVEVIKVELYPTYFYSIDEIGTGVRTKCHTYYTVNEINVVSKEEAFDEAKEKAVQRQEEFVGNLKKQLADAERYLALVRNVEFKG